MTHYFTILKLRNPAIGFFELLKDYFEALILQNVQEYEFILCLDRR